MSSVLIPLPTPARSAGYATGVFIAGAVFPDVSGGDGKGGSVWPSVCCDSLLEFNTDVTPAASSFCSFEEVSIDIISSFSTGVSRLLSKQSEPGLEGGNGTSEALISSFGGVGGAGGDRPLLGKYSESSVTSVSA